MAAEVHVHIDVPEIARLIRPMGDDPEYYLSYGPLDERTLRCLMGTAARHFKMDPHLDYYLEANQP